MSNRYKDARQCDCGFQTTHRGAWSIHRRTCSQREDHDPEKEHLRERCEALERQLAQYQEQLSVKDSQLADQQKTIDKLLQAAREERKRPRSVTHNHQPINNRYEVNNQINIFGKESLEHITEAKLQELIADPDTSVARLVTLKHSVEQNRNVRIPNVRDRWVQVLQEGEDGEKRWHSLPKDDVLGELVESTALELDAQASEDSVAGRRFTQWHERLLESTDQKGQLYRDQCSRVHKSLAEATRV